MGAVPLGALERARRRKAEIERREARRAHREAPMTGVAFDRIAGLYSDAYAHAANGDFDAASMVAEQAQELWEEVREPDSKVSKERDQR